MDEIENQDLIMEFLSNIDTKEEDFISHLIYCVIGENDEEFINELSMSLSPYEEYIQGDYDEPDEYYFKFYYNHNDVSHMIEYIIERSKEEMDKISKKYKNKK